MWRPPRWAWISSRGDTDLLRAAAETVHRVAAAVLADLDHDRSARDRSLSTATHTVLVDAASNQYQRPAIQ